ncbi:MULTISPECIES: DUF3221 domain-containing protein [Methanobacterium]|jgi:hypothetical protein|uniref:DUF3221 domain-containing protein n=1 Tax=Methanobacterium paludis (strain DSM 25820 / JCM 18151 / SWAN1) TaxID=868131 RepID=F6D4H4_METPW|nr:DUF3221 domain-containing protein [Methanobacterium paludis]AEG19214.1 hypothetical protein MSWAN_2206 [Methanobacterium paludis]
MKVITLVAILFFMFLGVVFGVLCATSGTPVDMKGQIIGIYESSPQPTLDSPNSILVQGVVTKGNQNLNVSVKITNETQIFKQDGNKQISSSYDNIKSGETVEIHFMGPVMSSYPPEATASEITIVS